MNKAIFEIGLEPISLSTIAKVWREKRKIGLSQAAKEKIVEGRAFLEKKVQRSKTPIYGVNTGFGSLCNTQIPENELDELQSNLVKSHACGLGEEISTELTQLMMLLKVRALSYGNSGVRLELAEKLMEIYNAQIYPVVYEQGSLGASGDLAPLAHMSLILLGEGEAYLNGKKMTAKEALDAKGITPIQLKAKEGLGLLNGTQFMNSHLILAVLKAIEYWNAANAIASLSLEAFNCQTSAFYLGLGNVRPHAGQLQTSLAINQYLEGSALAEQPNKAVQDPYSFRCIPQVHGATYTAINHVKHIAEVEMNSVTDNPVVFPHDDKIVSGGNFHGQELALALDYLGIAIAELASISERRGYLMLNGERNLPAYLTTKPGTQSGFMIPQYTAASIVSQNKQLASPASIDSIPSSNGQEDHVSMGANAATKTLKIVRNVGKVLGTELMISAQAWDLQKPYTRSAKTRALHKAYREQVKMLKNDRVLSPDMHLSAEFIDSYFLDSSWPS